MIMVVFEFTVKPGQEQAYFAFADGLQPIVGKIDGFLGVERYQSPFDRNKFVSISTWRDEAAVKAWRAQPKHKKAQDRGKKEIFESFKLRVTNILRETII
jgi:heme-degrading monooxygenase HmoA